MDLLLRVGIIDNLNIAGAVAIEQIQRTFAGQESFMHGITEIGNSSHTFALLIPLAAAVDMELACNLIVASTVGEWTSTLLKWTLMEGRPYWWVRETTAYQTLGLRPPVLKQTHLTCETGAGSPSGHTMHTAIIGLVFIQWLLPKLCPRSRWNADNGNLRRVLRVAYGCLISMVAFSRMFIAAHFPHQCMLGAIIGIPLAWALTNSKSPLANRWRRASQKELLLVAFLMILIAVAAFWLQKALGINPMWSVTLAFKWCADPRFISVSTTNVFSLVRNCGTALGFAIAAPRARRLQRMRVNLAVGLLLAMLINTGLNAAQRHIPTHDFVRYYVSQFFIYAAIPIILVLPSFINLTQPNLSASSSSERLSSFRRSNEAIVSSAARTPKKKSTIDGASTSSQGTNAHSKND